MTKTKKLEFQDKLGRVLRVGDIALYSVNSAGSCVLQFCKIIRIWTKEEERWEIGKSKSVSYDAPRITTIGVQEGNHGSIYLQCPGTLCYPEKMVVIEPKNVPKEIKDLLNKVKTE